MLRQLAQAQSCAYNAAAADDKGVHEKS